MSLNIKQSGRDDELSSTDNDSRRDTSFRERHLQLRNRSFLPRDKEAKAQEAAHSEEEERKMKNTNLERTHDGLGSSNCGRIRFDDGSRNYNCFDWRFSNEGNC